MDYRIGQGYDVHRLVSDRPLILGGVTIPFHLGLKGHSDADVLCHAIGDALLGAAALGDLGTHFPDTDPAYKNISSLSLLATIHQKIQKKGFTIGNIDATLILQKPKIAPYIPDMTRRVSESLSLSPAQLNIKATTEEGLGFTGRGEGVAASAIALVTYA